ncbi:MAG: hypothetical protein HC933_20020 [Pleurocapsa sp. SU_196_0]|nr:hypothetical protein [Pleurocapsa sp. SU_196_0]
MTKVRVDDDHPRGQGTVDVYVFGDGGLGVDVLNTVNAFIQARRPITSDIQVSSADVRLIDLHVTYRIRAGTRPLCEPAAIEALNQLERDLNIADTVTPSAVVDAILDRALGGLSVITDLNADIVLSETEVAQFNALFIFEEV